MLSGPSALAAYLETNDLSVDDFAPRVRAHRSQIYRALRGASDPDYRSPGADLRFRIEDATSGAVPARSWPRRRTTRRAAA